MRRIKFRCRHCGEYEEEDQQLLKVHENTCGIMRQLQLSGEIKSYRMEPAANKGKGGSNSGGNPYSDPHMNSLDVDSVARLIEGESKKKKNKKKKNKKGKDAPDEKIVEEEKILDDGGECKKVSEGENTVEVEKTLDDGGEGAPPATEYEDDGAWFDNKEILVTEPAIEGDAPASYGDYSDRESTDCDDVELNVERGVGDDAREKLVAEREHDVKVCERVVQCEIDRVTVMTAGDPIVTRVRELEKREKEMEDRFAAREQWLKERENDVMAATRARESELEASYKRTMDDLLKKHEAEKEQMPPDLKYPLKKKGVKSDELPLPDVLLAREIKLAKWEEDFKTRDKALKASELDLAARVNQAAMRENSSLRDLLKREKIYHERVTILTKTQRAVMNQQGQMAVDWLQIRRRGLELWEMVFEKERDLLERFGCT
ncbi:hypothetical protein Tco_0695853 [Tanacetum coccineum]